MRIRTLTLSVIILPLLMVIFSCGRQGDAEKTEIDIKNKPLFQLQQEFLDLRCGFCIWDTKTTDYHIMNSPFQRDAVMEFAEAFREEGLKVLLYHSILDTHHDIRKGWVREDHTQFIKGQLTELFSCRRTRAFLLHLLGLLNIE
jgi:hypothetical protein